MGSNKLEELGRGCLSSKSIARKSKINSKIDYIVCHRLNVAELHTMEDSLVPILQAALRTDSKVFNQAARENPPKQVSADEFRIACEQFHDLLPGYIIFATPDNDMEKAEKLLDLPDGTLGTYYVKTMKIHEHCNKCNRINNFLDVVVTGTESVHSREFLKDVFTGKHGQIVNTNKHQRCKCAECGNILPLEATKYLLPCVRKSTANSLLQGSYLYPVYTHKF